MPIPKTIALLLDEAARADKPVVAQQLIRSAQMILQSYGRSFADLMVDPEREAAPAAKPAPVGSSPVEPPVPLFAGKAAEKLPETVEPTAEKAPAKRGRKPKKAAEAVAATPVATPPVETKAATAPVPPPGRAAAPGFIAAIKGRDGDDIPVFRGTVHDFKLRSTGKGLALASFEIVTEDGEIGPKVVAFGEKAAEVAEIPPLMIRDFALIPNNRGGGMRLLFIRASRENRRAA